jgi:hypothetical protein
MFMQLYKIPKYAIILPDSVHILLPTVLPESK